MRKGPSHKSNWDWKIAKWAIRKAVNKEQKQEQKVENHPFWHAQF
jgi:hypothetical protein